MQCHILFLIIFWVVVWQTGWPNHRPIFLHSVTTKAELAICLDELLNLFPFASTDHCISAIWPFSRLVGIWGSSLWNAGRTGKWYTHTNLHTDTHTRTHTHTHTDHSRTYVTALNVDDSHKVANSLLTATLFPHESCSTALRRPKCTQVVLPKDLPTSTNNKYWHSTAYLP